MEVFQECKVSFNKRSGSYQRTVYKIDEKYYVIELTKDKVRFYVKRANGKYSAAEELGVPLRLIKECAKIQVSVLI